MPLVLLIISVSTFAQKPIDPDSFLIGKRKLPAVFMVGSFHFEYYNLDAHVTDKNLQVDIKSPGKQAELKQLLDYIAAFKPTKIAVEAGSNTGYLMKRYRDYIRGSYELKKDEREQIGFRLLEKFNLDTIYGVDDQELVSSFSELKDSNVIQPIIDSIFKDWDFRSNDTLSNLYKAWYSYDDRLAKELPLLSYFRYLNSDKALTRGYGAYLIGDFKLGNTRGADALALHWYSRNLRIFRHIQQITTSPDDRILVLFGAGHIQILKQLFESSPEYKLIKFNDL